MTSNHCEKTASLEESSCHTLAEALYYFTNPELRFELEEFRKEYESIHGETDLTRRYTSTWLTSQQEWLIKHDVKRYFEGLPLFVRAYFKKKMSDAARTGRLDDLPSHFVSLYLSGDCA